MKFTIVKCDDPRLKGFYEDLFGNEFDRAYEKALEENAVHYAHYFVTGELPPTLSSWEEAVWQD